MSCTTDAQDRIVKQIGDRSVSTECSPQPDGSLKIEAKSWGAGSTVWLRTVIVQPDGEITHDDEFDIDSYEDFR